MNHINFNVKNNNPIIKGRTSINTDERYKIKLGGCLN